MTWPLQKNAACLFTIAIKPAPFCARDAPGLDAPTRLALICPPMRRLLRKAATLVVAYSIALQVMLSGLVIGLHASFDPLAVICASDGAGDHHAPPPQNESDCRACPLACGAGSPAVMPSGAKLCLARFADEVRLSAVWLEALPSPAKHQPQASRAPPIAG
jgi:hypothetical protein